MKKLMNFNQVGALCSDKSSKTEKRLVRRAKAGDQEAFTQLYDQHVSSIYGFIFSRVNEGMAAEDLTSQVFLKAWENIGQFQQQGLPLRAWLFRIARNMLIDHYRTTKDHECLELLPSDRIDAEGEVEEKLEGYWEEEALAGAMAQLTVEQRRAIGLKFLEGRNNREVAHAMGKEVGAIRALQMRGIQMLAKILNSPEQEVSGQ